MRSFLKSVGMQVSMSVYFAGKKAQAQPDLACEMCSDWKTSGQLCIQTLVSHEYKNISTDGEGSLVCMVFVF